ncbi:MAG: lipid-A-disaccharide synthase [Planctomycetota bacterium]|nr:lipid-A-disaccharide synthase [Planctomycetota bacterium]
MSHPPTIFLSAAEASGDEHAANLIRALRQRLPDARFVGVAGDRMAEAGCEVVADLTKRASMLGGPILRVGYYYRQVRRIQRAMRQIEPDVHVPVDSPALNWHLAATAREIGTPVMYYIAPQVWAWAPGRVKKMAALTDQVACILPFEERYLRDRGVRATYVGHPLFDTLEPAPTPAPDIMDAWATGAWQVAMLPGSRPSEIRNHAPAMAYVAERICRRWPKARCTFPMGSPESAEILAKVIGSRTHERVGVTVGRTREVLAGSHFAVAVSGTVTLEVAHFGVPMIVIYRLSRLTYALVGRWIINTPHLSLVNILAGRKIVHEMMPWYGSKRRLLEMTVEVMNELGYLLEVRQQLQDIVRPLRVPPPDTACGRAADLGLQVMQKRPVVQE